MQQLAIATAAHGLLRERIRSEDPLIDEVTLADTLEGLTDLHEMVAAVVRWGLLD